MLGARTAAWSGEALPYDAEVEYLESTGTQWIDTGIIATENTRIKATLMTLSTGNKNWFGGQVMPEKSGFAFNSYFDKLQYLFGNSNWVIVRVSNVVSRIFTVDFGKDGLVINGKSVSTPSYTTFPRQSASIKIFIRDGGNAYINGRLYDLHISVRRHRQRLHSRPRWHSRLSLRPRVWSVLRQRRHWRVYNRT